MMYVGRIPQTLWLKDMVKYAYVNMKGSINHDAAWPDRKCLRSLRKLFIPNCPVSTLDLSCPVKGKVSQHDASETTSNILTTFSNPCSSPRPPSSPYTTSRRDSLDLLLEFNPFTTQNPVTPISSPPT